MLFRAIYLVPVLFKQRAGALQFALFVVIYYGCHNRLISTFLVFFPRNRPPEGGSYQNSGGESYQNNAVDQSFWETFGNSDPPKAHKSPSSESWTYVDNSTEKKSSDSWDVWGSGTVSNNKNSNSDSWENWETNWENAGGESKTRKPPKATKKASSAGDGWDNQNW